MNRLFLKEHKHITGADGWTVESNLEYRRQYAPDILWELKDKIDEIEKRGDLLPNSDLQKAITYMRNGWNALVDIFNYGIQNWKTIPWSVLTGIFQYPEGILC